jgi:hypothetical protein
LAAIDRREAARGQGLAHEPAARAGIENGGVRSDEASGEVGQHLVPAPAEVLEHPAFVVRGMAVVLGLEIGGRLRAIELLDVERLGHASNPSACLAAQVRVSDRGLAITSVA